MKGISVEIWKEKRMFPHFLSSLVFLFAQDACSVCCNVIIGSKIRISKFGMLSNHVPMELNFISVKVISL